MSQRTVMEQIKAFGAKQAIAYVDKDPDTNIPKLVDWLERHDSAGTLKPQLTVVKKYLNDPENNWYKLLKSLWSDIDDDVRKKIFENFLVHASMIGSKRQWEVQAKESCNVPWAILLDPTSACNLKCKGCWAADYGSSLNLSFEEMDSIISQGKELGTFMYLFTGGEPLVKKKEVLKICEKHNDCVFLAFTNATLIDEEFAEEMLRVRNFIPAISIEGFEEATDFRRGRGTYKAIVRAMEILKERKLPFGISCCYTSKNTEVIGSEEFFDDMIAKGAKFAWLFTYMPVGLDAMPELLVSAEQRKFMYDQVRKFRTTKEIFTMDFWNDGEFVGGCIAGGRSYLHINANGDIEPCAFIHYSDSNIRDKTLLEAYKSPLFMNYRKNQPFSDNMLRPCPLLDNPGALSEIVKETGAHSTDMKHPENVDNLTEKCINAANCWKPVADKIWHDDKHHNYAGPRKG